jgi:GT2 family glycosyltransferase
MPKDGRPEMTNPRISVIILNWNGLEDTIECLESLKKITYTNYEVIVVDNGSRGNDAAVLQEKFGDYIHLIRNDRNYGYTGGNNIAMRYVMNHSAPDYLLILNNDTIVAPDFLGQMINVAESNVSIGMVGPKVYYHSFSNRIQSAGAEVNMWTGQPSLVGIKEIDAGQYDTQREVDYVFGCCLLVKKEVIQKVGLFDESYFCYWDEIDYCFRAKTAGYKLVYVPEAGIWHKAPVKLKLWDKVPVSSKASGLPYYYMARNNFKFMKKYATRKQYHSFLFYFFGYHFWFITAVCLLYHRDVERLLGFYRGVKDGVFNSYSCAKYYMGH